MTQKTQDAVAKREEQMASRVAVKAKAKKSKPTDVDVTTDKAPE